MGLFDWLTGKKDTVEIAEDRIWLTRQAKNAGVRNEVAQAVADPAGAHALIVVAHFKDCLEQLRTVVVGADCKGRTESVAAGGDRWAVRKRSALGNAWLRIVTDSCFSPAIPSRATRSRKGVPKHGEMGGDST